MMLIKKLHDEKQLMIMMFILHKKSRKHKEMWGWSRDVGWIARSSVGQSVVVVVVVGWGGQRTGTVLALLTLGAYTVNIYKYHNPLRKKPLTSSAVSCSSLQDPPGCPFLNRPWENPLILECQLETWQSLLEPDANIIFLYIFRSGVFIFSLFPDYFTTTRLFDTL